MRSVRFTAASPCIGSKPQTLKRSDMHAHKRGCQAVQPRPKHDAASRTASYFGESPDPTVRPGRGRALTRLPRSLRRCSALATRNRFGDEVIAPVAGAGRLLRHGCVVSHGGFGRVLSPKGRRPLSGSLANAAQRGGDRETRPCARSGASFAARSVARETPTTIGQEVLTIGHDLRIRWSVFCVWLPLP